jgi:Zn-dependent M28 family amino/carboxypeptidase
MGGRGSSSTKQDTMAVHHGADDNASGVTAILGIARKITTLKQPLKRSLIFIAFDGEEEGLLGSKYYVNNPVIPLGKTMVMLNFDMVGRLKEDKTLQLAGTGTAAESDSILKSILTGFNFKSTFDPGGTGPSDYASFYGKNIPVISFTTGVHPDYHTPEDKPEKINYQGLSEIINLSTKLITELANRDKPLTYKQVSSPSETRNVRRGKVSLGIMPDFSGAEKNGLRVDGVTKGKPADKAGVLKDDIITAINGAPIKDIYEYMYQMGKCNQGDKIIVEIKRNEKLIKLEVEL